jgi:hypothetical protein
MVCTTAAMTAAQARLAETIDSFYTDSSDAAMSAHSYHRAVDELEATTARELDAPYRATVLEPIGRLCSYRECYAVQARAH